MTEVPEHLLKRSRDRRAALGLGGGDGGGGDEAPTAPPSAEPASTEVAAAAATAAAPVAAATPAVVEPPKPRPPYVEAALRRKKIPFWAMPVLAFLPVWALIWVGSLSPATKPGQVGPLQLGAQVFAANCAVCHGAGGGGGVGRPLSNGDVVATFPDIAGQLEFVANGSDGMGPPGTPYGDPNREGGQHSTLSYNGQKMPAFGEVLTPQELLNVVRYEREVLGGEDVPPEQVGDADQRFWPDGSTIITTGGTGLTGPTGEPLFDDSGRLAVPPSYAPAA